MTTVTIVPLSEANRRTSPVFRHSPPPIFPDGEPTQDDIALAIALLDELDDESRAWYGTTADSLQAQLHD